MRLLFQNKTIISLFDCFFFQSIDISGNFAMGEKSLKINLYQQQAFCKEYALKQLLSCGFEDVFVTLNFLFFIK